jgi:hypothetical protein
VAKIYISSTYNDLKECREKVYRTLRMMRYDVIAMEDYVATDQRPVAKCLEDVAHCDLYIGIFAWRYGYIPSESNPQNKSITELEYRKAAALGKPCLIFFLHEEAPWPSRLIDANTSEIQNLRQELQRERHVSFFNSIDELINLISPAIYTWEIDRSHQKPVLQPLDHVSQIGDKSLSSISKRGNSIEVFFSYSHKDEKLRNKLETQLSLLKQQGQITEWHDRKISAGREWADEINEHLNTADIILLLVSPDFLASEYCYSNELKRALERHERGEARVIPVILRRVYWQGAPFGKLQALPTDAKPVTGPNWHNQDEAFFNVAEGIRKAVEDIITNPNVESLFMRGVKIPVQKSALPLPSAMDDQTFSPITVSTSQLSHPQIDFNQLYDILAKYASSFDLRKICRTVRVDYNRLEGNTHAEKAFALTSRLENEDRLSDLEEELRQMFPKRFPNKGIKQLPIEAQTDSDSTQVFINPIKLCKAMLRAFDLREFRLLCADLEVPYGDLDGDTLEERMQSLIDYVRRRARYDELVRMIVKLRPHLEDELGSPE